MTTAFWSLTVSGPVAPWPEIVKTQFRAPFDEWNAQGDSAEHGELTSVEIGPEDDPRRAGGSGWRVARAVAWERPLWGENSYGEGAQWSGGAQVCALYSPKARGNKEGQDWEKDLASVIFGKKNQ
jgi:hypothetical protein